MRTFTFIRSYALSLAKMAFQAKNLSMIYGIVFNEFKTIFQDYIILIKAYRLYLYLMNHEPNCLKDTKP